MNPEVEKIKSELEDAQAALAEEFGIGRAEIAGELEEDNLALAEALVQYEQTGDDRQLELMKQIAEAAPAHLALPSLRLRLLTRQKVLRLFGTLISSSLTLAANRIRPAGPALLALGMLLVSGCAAIMHPHAVEGPLLRGIVKNTCWVVDQCVQQGTIPLDVSACSSEEGSLWSETQGKWVHGQVITDGSAEACDAIEVCLANGADFPPNAVVQYRRWCSELEGIGRAAVGS